MIYVRLWNMNIDRCQYMTWCSINRLIPDGYFLTEYQKYDLGNYCLCLCGDDGFGFPCVMIPCWDGEVSKKTVFVEDDIAFYSHQLVYQG